MKTSCATDGATVSCWTLKILNVRLCPHLLLLREGQRAHGAAVLPEVFDLQDEAIALHLHDFLQTGKNRAILEPQQYNAASFSQSGSRLATGFVSARPSAVHDQVSRTFRGTALKT